MNSLDFEPKKTALMESELQLNLLAENLPAVLFKAAPDGSIVYVNQKGSAIVVIRCGFTQTELTKSRSSSYFKT